MKGLYISLAILGVLVLLAGPALPLERVRVGTSVRESPFYNLPILAGEDMGFWREEGLELQFLPFKGGTEMHRAVAAASLDVGVSGAISVVQNISRGLPEVIVADMQADNAFYLWVPTESSIREPKDLKGARIGVNRFGGTVHAFARALAKALKMEKEIRFVAGGGVREELAAMKAAKLQGRVSEKFTMAPLKFAGEVRELVSVKDFLPREWPDLVIFARKDFSETKPEATRKSIRAILKGADYLQRDQAWAVEKMRMAFGFTEGLARGVYQDLRYGKDGRIDRKGLENVRNFLMEYGIVPKEKAPPLEKLFTREFTE